MDGKITVLTSVSLSLTVDDVLSHSHNPIGSTVWLLLLFLAREQLAWYADDRDLWGLFGHWL